MEKNSYIFSKRLFFLRDKHKMSQESLGSKLNLSKKSISVYESAKAQPDINTLAKISSIFNVTVDYLLGLSDTLESNDKITYPTLLHKEICDKIIHVTDDKCLQTVNNILDMYNDILETKRYRELNAAFKEQEKAKQEFLDLAFSDDDDIKKQA